MSIADKKVTLDLPELALIGMTRAMLGAGIGLCLARFVKKDARKAIGLALLAVGVLTTIPLAMQVRAKLSD